MPTPIQATSPAALGHNQPRRRGPDGRARRKASLVPTHAAHLLFASSKVLRLVTVTAIVGRDDEPGDFWGTDRRRCARPPWGRRGDRS